MMSYGDTPLIRELYGDWCDITAAARWARPPAHAAIY
jgi:hypothetical protein